MAEGNLGITYSTGVQAADALCQARARAASLTGDFVAWISSSTSNAIDRLGNQNNLGYVLTDGTVIADNTADLIDSELEAHIDRDEFNNLVGSKGVWTGTKNTGVVYQQYTCNDWKHPDSSHTGLIGDAGSMSSTSHWTLGLTSGCDKQFRLYCFEK
jgi:hypothetical protein